MKLRFIGDVHGHIPNYLAIRGNGPSFQLGDMGLGFGFAPFKDDSGKHRFIRGNHDDPGQCKSHRNYAGEFGYDERFKLFFLGGAFSIDYAWRQRRNILDPDNPIWWPDEEQSQEALNQAAELYAKTKPEIVATHDCPTTVSEKILGAMLVGFRPEKKVHTRTGDALQRMFMLHQPRLWLFGHYHIDVSTVIGGTEFMCLDELSYRDVEIREEEEKC